MSSDIFVICRPIHLISQVRPQEDVLKYPNVGIYLIKMFKKLTFESSIQLFPLKVMLL